MWGKESHITTRLPLYYNHYTSFGFCLAGLHFQRPELDWIFKAEPLATAETSFDKSDALPTNKNRQKHHKKTTVYKEILVIK